MAAGKLSKPDLIALVVRSLRLSGWQTLVVQDTHPTPVRIIRDGEAIDVWLHIWNLTTGGRSTSRPLERRIQPTNIGNSFKTKAGAKTLILGWSAETEVFAAFDHNYHAGTIGESSSLQTDLPALEAAANHGLGIYSKATGELSVAVRPDLLGLYLEQMETLHKAGTNQAELEVLKRMAESPLDVDPEEMDTQVPAKRRKAMSVTLRLLRDRRFGQRVLSAYGHRCALCEVQLRMLDAAHILPVAHPKSDDHITNGVALCPLHHRAYDGALITFDTSFAVKFSSAAVAELENEGKAGGLKAFKAAIRPLLLLPNAPAHYPAKAMIEQANVLRGWP